MTRIALGIDLSMELVLALLIGPTEDDDLTDEDLELGWRYRGEQIMEDYRGVLGTRPWGWWKFAAGEEKPASDRGAEAVRLAELGELRADELAALRERANEAKLRIGTPRERVSGGGVPHGVSVDVRDVELFEAVTAAGDRPT